jgi:glutaredoxin
VKEFLSRAGVPFRVLNVDEDPGAYDALIALKWRTVPVTLIAGRTINGYDPAALQQALDGQL